jgi:ferric-dicitrate binding protein FerR (iron transport regulator)
MKIEQENHILQLIIRYLQDDITDDERKFIADWIAESETNKTYFNDVKNLWNTSGNVIDFDQINVDEQWEKFKSSTIITKNKKQKSNSIYLKIAASIVVLLGLSFYVNSLLNAEITLMAKAGTENKFLLPDGSTVWLNNGSQLTYKKDFEGDSRELHLQGEGFFEVTKNNNKPFIVNTNATQTKVLGTSFNLKNDLKTKEVELVLVTGNVEFSSETHKEILVPGDRVKATVNGELVKEINKSPNFLSWKSGVLTFDKTFMHQVVKDIQSHYHKQLIIDNQELVNCTLTTTFNNESFEDVLETLKILFDLTYKQNDPNTIIMKGGNCNL